MVGMPGSLTSDEKLVVTRPRGRGGRPGHLETIVLQANLDVHESVLRAAEPMNEMGLRPPRPFAQAEGSGVARSDARPSSRRRRTQPPAANEPTLEIIFTAVIPFI